MLAWGRTPRPFCEGEDDDVAVHVALWDSEHAFGVDGQEWRWVVEVCGCGECCLDG